MTKFTHLDVLAGPDLSSIDKDGIRFYPLDDDNIFPSITTVLSLRKQKSLAAWRKRIGEEKALRIMERASERGTDLHSSVELYLQNKEVIHTNNFTKYLFHGIKPALDRINNIHVQERALYSKKLKCAGRVDCIAEFDGKLSVIDFKTSTEIKPRNWIDSYFHQAMFYAAAYYEMTGIKPERLVILMVSEYNECEVFSEPLNWNYLKEVRDQIAEFNQTVQK